MGEELYCDYCGASAPIPDALKAIISDKTEIARVCINCRQQIENIIKSQKNKVISARQETIKLGEQYRNMKEEEAAAELVRQEAAKEADLSPVELNKEVNDGVARDSESGTEKEEESTDEAKIEETERVS